MCLKTTFVDYLSSCRQVRNRKPPGAREHTNTPHNADRIRASAEEAESSPTFQALVKQTKSQFMGSHHKSAHDSFWLCAVGHWFRNSRCYIKLFESNEPLNTDELFKSYVGAFARERDTVRYYAPVELADFTERLDFESFKVVKYAADDLRNLLRNDINELFYPYAVTRPEVLKDYWFIEVQQEKEAHRVGRIEIPGWERMFYERRRFSEFPACLETALQQMILFRIPDRVKELVGHQSWFDIPFAIKVEGSLLKSPAQAPDLAPLLSGREPVIDPEGNEVGDRPTIICDLDKNETRRFEEFIRETEALWAMPEQWAFISLARGYLLKAFLTRGLEQLLWHVTALETLVGEKGQTTEDLRRRLSYIHGSTESEQKDIRKRIGELYDMRCDLVHGNVRTSEKVAVGLLDDARELARSTVLWFLHFAAHVRRSLQGNPLPERKDLLKVLDLGKRRGVIRRVIECIPAGFPNVAGWKE